MATAIVTGSGGLIGSESVRHLIESGYRVIGIENDMRSQFFGDSASTRPVSERLVSRFGDDGFEKMVDRVASIEKALGIYDLAQFTPKV